MITIADRMHACLALGTGAKSIPPSLIHTSTPFDSSPTASPRTLERSLPVPPSLEGTHVCSSIPGSALLPFSRAGLRTPTLAFRPRNNGAAVPPLHLPGPANVGTPATHRTCRLRFSLHVILPCAYRSSIDRKKYACSIIIQRQDDLLRIGMTDGCQDSPFGPAGRVVRLWNGGRGLCSGRGRSRRRRVGRRRGRSWGLRFPSGWNEMEKARQRMRERDGKMSSG